MLTGIASAAMAEPISFWHTYCGSSTKTEVMSEMLAKFREENPDVELEIEEANSAMHSMAPVSPPRWRRMIFPICICTGAASR